MALTDREIIKERHAGQAQAFGLAGAPKDAVAEVHRDILTWDIGSDASIAEIGQRLDRKCRVISAYVTPTTLLAKHASAFITLLVQKRDGAGGSPVTVATAHTEDIAGGVALAAFVPTLLTLTTTAADIAVAAGNILTFKSTETGAPATPIGKVTVVVEWV